jgi:L-threonylcarbamoyladenylate synthase
MDKSSIQKASEIIKAGGVVAFPTETVYGLGADAFAPVAVARIFEIKRRPRFDPLIVHICHPRQLEKLVLHVPLNAKRLMDRFWPGPITFVLPKREAVPDIVTAGLETVAVRMPNHSMALRLIELSGSPIAAPSANPFGAVSPTTADHVREQLGPEVDLILDGGPCRVGLESTILSFGRKPRLLRPGGISLEEIQTIIGKVEVSRPALELVSAPGMLPRHYAPRTPIILARDGEVLDLDGERSNIGYLLFREQPGNIRSGSVEVLSAEGDLREAAANLFTAIRRLDALGLEKIIAQPVPEVGLGRAIMDRLRRASHTEEGGGSES